MLRKLKSPLGLFSLCFLLVAVLSLNPLLALAAPSAQTATAIRVNQVGYLPNLNKLATVVSTSTTALTWQLKNSGGTVVASGSTTVFGNDAASGEQVHIADFSSFTTQGTGYTLVVGSTVSNPFDIGPAIYHTLKYDALAYYYQTRSGIAITLPYAVRSDLTRPAGHIGVAPNQGDTNVPCASDAGCSYSLNVSGGWYDAGDQGKYVVNGGISVWTLMNEYERTKFLGTSSADFANGKMNIPENGNGVPDILDEARWEMEFLLKMQVPTGQPHAGMAHHKMHDANWTGIPQRPEQDSQPRVLRPVSTAATLNLAATAAQCARIWATIDATFSNKCLTAAQTAWTAAQANPSIIASGSDGNGGGAYGDPTVNDEFYWAAAELYITTGSSTYLNFLTSSPLYKVIISNPSSMNWGSTQVLGDISLAVVPNSLAAGEVTSIRNNIVAAANAYVNTSNSQGYRVPFAGGTGGAYYWGDNSDVANNGVIMALAYDFTGGTQYLNGANEAMNYLLGRNAMSKSYVSGYGENPLLNPHHRFWAKQADASFPSPPAGVMAGGPDSGLDDPYAQANLVGCKPQKCYVDNYQSYSTNEEAINWNAPLAWLAAYLDEKGGPGGPVLTPTPTNTQPTNTPTRTRTPTTGPSFTPTRTSTITPTGLITSTPTLTRTISPTPTRTSTQACIAPTQVAFSVAPVTSPTTATTQTITVTISLNNADSATVISEAGSFTQTGPTNLFNVPINLVPNSTNHLQVQIVITYAPGCSYTLSKTTDSGGNPLNIVQTSGGITNTPTPTRTFTPTIPPVITNTPTRTFTPTTPPVLTNTPTQPVGGACTPVTSIITAPFTWDGAGIYCWQIATIPGYVNNWNNNSVSINGTNYTNIYVASGSLPAKINNNYYISFNGAFAWSHIEVR